MEKMVQQSQAVEADPDVFFVLLRENVSSLST